MSGKKITIAAQRPSAAKAASKSEELARAADALVRGRGEGEGEPTRRITIDVPASLHARVKGECGLRGVNIKEELTALLLEKYPPR